ncbi:DUF6338 family protein [Thiohalobacter thiocyanaticus]|uniref:DUF6338 family protein n=1 Tax=Thiohalobacter thiocyanaticus TaxID=585455 RepID=UPI0012FDFF1E|nr:DUF6338 family protein [Thiohalobacter thiocyanaticus]
MTLTVEALNILLLLLPGFLSGQIFYSCFRFGEISISRRILDAILFTFVIYLVVSTFTVWEPLAQVASTESGLSFDFSASKTLIWLSLSTVGLIPTVVGFIYFNDHVHKVLRKLKITTKTSRANTWNDTFQTQDRYVIVTLKDGRRIRGYPTMFSTDPEEGFVYLYNPAWVNDNKSDIEEPDYIESNCHGFLVNRDNLDLLEFTLDPGETLTAKA